MATLVEKLVHHYHTAMEAGDPRTADWPFMSTPWTTLGLVSLYLVVVMVGPQIMRRREAFQINWLLVVYNFGLILLYSYMLYESLLSALSIPGFNFWCQGVNPGFHPSQGVNPGFHPSLLRHARVSWLFFVCKFVELSDTIFFILRKKNNQVRFLHVYHHISVPLMCWIVVKWHPGGTTFFGAALNCLLHVVVYFYYMVSAFGPHYRKYLWWKKYVTSLQLLQFILIMVHILYAMTLQDCTTPPWILRLFFSYLVTMTILFTNLYLQEYVYRAGELTKLKSK